MSDFETVRNNIKPGWPEDLEAEAALDRIEAEVERLRQSNEMCEEELDKRDAEVERLREHSENLGTALLESRAEVERLRKQLDECEQDWKDTARAALAKEEA